MHEWINKYKDSWFDLVIYLRPRKNVGMYKWIYDEHFQSRDTGISINNEYENNTLLDMQSTISEDTDRQWNICDSILILHVGSDMHSMIVCIAIPPVKFISWRSSNFK